MNSLAEQIIVDILSNQMSIDAQNVWIRHQDRLIPNTDDIFIVVGMLSSQPFGINKYYEENSTDATKLDEVITVLAKEQIQIDIMSRNNDALMRRYEVLAALKSIYSVQKQEENDFKIFDIPMSFVNVSDVEGGSRINRFSMTVTAHVWYRKTTTLADGDVYDEFSSRVDDANTIDQPEGIIEFTIDENTDIGSLA